MVTSQGSRTTAEQRLIRHIGVLRLAATIGATATLVFTLCWLGTFIAFSSPTHAYIGLFTDAGTQSVEALAKGGVWSLVFGTLSGGLIAALFNLFSGLDQRRAP